MRIESAICPPTRLRLHILSFLDTIYAVRTTILSKAWNRLWVSLPCLKFDHEEGSFECFGKRSKGNVSFVNFVDKVILLRDPVTSIQKFCLSSPDSIEESQLDRWLNAAARSNVYDLDLDVDLRRHFELPSCLINSNSLQSLSLIFNKRMTLDISTSICFPQLKFLCVTLCRYEFDFTTKLFSNCPALEELEIDCYSAPKGDFKIFSSSLTKLTMGFDSNPIDHSHIQDCRVLIHCPNLSYLSISDTYLPQYVITHPASIEHVNLHVGRFYRHEYEDFEIMMLGLEAHVPDPKRALKLLRKISKVRDLTLSKYTMVESIERPELEFNWKPGKEIEWKPSSLSRNYPLPNLEVIDVKEFEGGDNELELVRYLLRNATDLKEFTVWPKASVLEKELLHQTVLSFPKASTSYSVSFR